jgi:hypothetical protein
MCVVVLCLRWAPIISKKPPHICSGRNEDGRINILVLTQLFFPLENVLHRHYAWERHKSEEAAGCGVIGNVLVPRKRSDVQKMKTETETLSQPTKRDAVLRAVQRV